MTPSLPVAAVILALQTTPPPAPAPSSPATTAHARRAMVPPVIDGKDDDEVWRLAQTITAFRQFRPVEDADPTIRTEAKVAYDDRNFYAFVRAFDPHPDSILKLLARRDTRVCCDQLKIVIDSYHDRRTGYEFAVSPAGVKRDYAIYDDTQEDQTWDGVWEVATQVPATSSGLRSGVISTVVISSG
jgi:Carbohydrate family 9 binding domain-like